MSKQAHPNINAAGLSVDVTMAIKKRARGEMKDDGPLAPEIMEMVQQFCVSISVALDILAMRKRGNVETHE